MEILSIPVPIEPRDNCFFMYDNKVYEGKVISSQISLTSSSNQTMISQSFKVEYGQYQNKSEVTVYSVFKTKQDLLDSL